MTPPSPSLRPLDDLQTLVLEWIRQHPGHNTESIAQEMIVENPLLEHEELVNAVEYVVWNDYATRDKYERIYHRPQPK